MYADLRDFLAQLQQRNLLKHIRAEVSPKLEMTEICRRTLERDGPALLFERPTGYDIPVLGNLFGTVERVALALGQESIADLREVGKLLAFLKEPDPPRGLEGCVGEAPGLQEDPRHGAQGSP